MEVITLDGLPALTAREETFCIQLVKTDDRHAAYRAAFPYGRDESAVLVRQPKIQARLRELNTAAGQVLKFDLVDVIRQYVTIATANVDDVVSLRIGCCRYCHGEGHGYQWRQREYLERLAEVETFNRQAASPLLHLPLPDVAGGFGFSHTRDPAEDCPECAGEGVQRVVARDTSKLGPAASLLYDGVKKTKDGFEVMVADRMKALDKLYTAFGGSTENVNVKLQALLANLNAGDEEAAMADIASLAPDQAALAYRAMVTHET